MSWESERERPDWKRWDAEKRAKCVIRVPALDNERFGGCWSARRGRVEIRNRRIEVTRVEARQKKTEVYARADNVKKKKKGTSGCGIAYGTL